MEYAAVEPWGFPAADLHTGILAAAVANAAGAKVGPKDFMVSMRPVEEDVDATAEVERFALAIGARARPN